jgi:hypothetical protein
MRVFNYSNVMGARLYIVCLMAKDVGPCQGAQRGNSDTKGSHMANRSAK